MIFLRLLTSLTLSRKSSVALAVALAALVLIGATYYRGFSAGFSKAEAIWEQKVREEVERQRERDAEALRLARERTRVLLDREEQLNAELERLRELAAEDPDSGRPAIGPDSVQRLNRIR